MLTFWKKPDTKLKERILKNKEAILDVMASNIQGARMCPLLGGQKCIGQMCEHFMQFTVTDTETGTESRQWQCAHVKVPALLIELNRNLREFNARTT